MPNRMAPFPPLRCCERIAELYRESYKLYLPRLQRKAYVFLRMIDLLIPNQIKRKRTRYLPYCTNSFRFIQ